jgi:tRNA nucleotidyltransferase/poly(A) polymerase
VKRTLFSAVPWTHLGVTIMPPVDPVLARRFAVEVVRRLREYGHTAFWAGGCVRDQLMGQMPKDYDVATDATPQRVQEIFGRRRTLFIGAAFGVVTVVGRKGEGQIDVATFRCDAAYSDGRHPDAVVFADAEQDARRRDFTINGLFYDPLEERVIDYVGGVADLKQRLIRAIGDPDARLSEDKLRMLRAVRFAARFDFTIEEKTWEAIVRHAPELVIVSAERIAAEMRLILTHDRRARGVELLAESGLLEVILPEAKLWRREESAPGRPSPEQKTASWERTLEILRRLKAPTFAVALAALLRELHLACGSDDLPHLVAQRWKLSSDEREGVEKLLSEEAIIRTAPQQPWPKLQRILTAPRCDELLAYCEAVAEVVDGNTVAIEFCRSKLALPREQLDPPPLIGGDDLKRLGIPPGPVYRQLLDAVRDAQLEQRIDTRAQALEMARQQFQQQAQSTLPGPAQADSAG